MSLLYYTANKSLGIIPKDEIGRRQSFLFNTPAYNIALSIIKEGIDIEDKLRFFTQWGKKIQIGNVVVESTPTNSFNILISGELFSTYPSLYMEILDVIFKKDEESCKSIVYRMLGDGINLKRITEHFPSIEVIDTPTRKDLCIKGKLGIWTINRDTLSCCFNGEPICIVCYDTYKNSEFTEKEQLLMSKMLAFTNDEMFYKTDGTIKSQMDYILKSR